MGTPEANRLLAFDKVFVAAGASVDVSFALHTNELSYIGVDFDRVVETGPYTLALGDSQFGAPGAGDECFASGMCVGLTATHAGCTTQVCTVSMTDGAGKSAAPNYNHPVPDVPYGSQTGALSNAPTNAAAAADESPSGTFFFLFCMGFAVGSIGFYVSQKIGLFKDD